MSEDFVPTGREGTYRANARREISAKGATKTLTYVMYVCAICQLWAHDQMRMAHGTVLSPSTEA